MNTAMDKAKEPIMKMAAKALDPIGKIINDKFDKSNAKFSVKVTKKTTTYARFPGVKAFIDDLPESKSCADSAKKLLTSINKMNKCEDYACYLTFNFRANDTIKKFIPFIEELEENNFRLAIALSDMSYVLARAMIRAFTPFVTTVDALSKDFDKGKVKKQIEDAVREGGKKLALDYFSLPSSLRKTCKGIGNKATRQVLKLAKKTVIKIADLLGQIALAYKPTSKDDAKQAFVTVAIPLLDKFLNDRIDAIIMTLRKSTQNMIADKLMKICKDAIDPILTTLDELVKMIPEPIGNNLKVSKIVYYILGKAVSNITAIAVNFLSKTVMTNIYDPNSSPKPLDKATCKKLRKAPKVSDKDFDDEPEGGDDDDAKEDGDGDADADAGGDDAGDDAGGDDAGGDE